MKKLLIFMLVLGMASLANAALQISVGGVKEPIDSEIIVAPSDYLVLDIWTDANISQGVAEVYWALAADVAKATIVKGVALVIDPAITIENDARGEGMMPLPDAENGVWGMLGLVTVPSIPAGTTIFDEILFHCEQLGDVTVNLYGTHDWVIFTPLDSVVIHQIPEPATIALLGLGGLFLRRRNKQQTA